MASPCLVVPIDGYRYAQPILRALTPVPLFPCSPVPLAPWQSARPRRPRFRWHPPRPGSATAGSAAPNTASMPMSTPALRGLSIRARRSAPEARWIMAFLRTASPSRAMAIASLNPSYAFRVWLLLSAPPDSSLAATYGPYDGNLSRAGAGQSDKSLY